MKPIIGNLFALVIALIIACLSGEPIIRALHKANFGQEIRDVGPSWHKAKSGTPTMGAFIFAVGLLPAALFIWILSGSWETADVAVLGCALLFGAVGFIDDYIKVIKKRNLGLTAGKKFALQALVSIAFAAVLYVECGGEINLFSAHDWSFMILPFNVFVLLATVNAVNLTDGVDALAGSTTAIVMAFFAFAAWIMEAPALGILLSAAIGGVLGFLVFNHHPAKVFMGDTGSLFLGGLIGAAACRLGLQFTLILCGFVFFAETLSVMLQVSYFKLTHGKRIFLMTPIHHHFEKKGWSEVRIVCVASAITLIGSLISLWYVMVTCS